MVRAVNTDFSGANLTGVSFNDADLDHADFSAAILRGAMFFLLLNPMVNTDFAGADLSGSVLAGRDESSANFSGANLMNAVLGFSLNASEFSSQTTYNQWTQFPDDFDPTSRGLTYLESSPGDLDGIDGLSAEDVDYLSRRIRTGFMSWQPVEMFDLNADSVVDHDDISVWVKDIKHTYFGDANLDGEFNSNDLVAVFVHGEYEDQVSVNSSWATGDWNADGEFDSSDLVRAFQDGGFEQGPRVAVNAVPEPTSVVLLAVSLLFAVAAPSQRRSRS
jgi:uncharacterized protein YjbI with pentapeptide repeats